MSKGKVFQTVRAATGKLRELKANISRSFETRSGAVQLWRRVVDECSLSKSAASWPNVTVSSSSASAADDAGEGKSDSDALSVAAAAAAAAGSVEQDSDNELLINGADCRRRPANSLNVRASIAPRGNLSQSYGQSLVLWDHTVLPTT